jgi:O-antigen/teichoic acid export membrane protein
METDKVETSADRRAALDPLGAIRRFRARLLLSGHSRTKKAYLNATAAGLDYGARMVVGFLVNPILVAGLGAYLYGVWQVLARLKGYLSAATGRPTEALKWAVAYRQASIDYEEKRRLLGAAVVVWLLFLPVLSGLGLAVAWFAPAWLKSPPEYVWVVRLAAVVLMVDLIITSLVDMPESVLRGENLGYKRMGLTTLLVFIQGSMVAAAVYLNTSIVGVAVAILLDTMITATLFWYVVRSNVPWFGIAWPAAREVRRFLGLSWWFLAWRVVMQTMTGSDVVVLGILASPEAVTTYTLTKYVPETLVSLVAIVMSGITPGLGGMIGSGNLPQVARVRNEFLAGTWLLATTVGTTTLLWNRSFVRLWVGDKFYAGPTPLFLIMLMIVQFVLIRNDANIIDLTLNLQRKVLLGALSATLAVVMGGILATTFGLGIAGLAVGFILGRSILSVGYPWMIGRLLGVSLASQLASVLRPVAIAGALFLIASGLSNTLIAATWPALVLKVGTTAVGVACLGFYAGLSREQRERLRRRARLSYRPTGA